MGRPLAILALSAGVACTSGTAPPGGTGGGGWPDSGSTDAGVPWPTPGTPLFDFGPFIDGGTFVANGSPVASIYWDGGVKTIVFTGVKGPKLVIHYPDRDHIDVTGDQDGDGVVDYRFTSVFDGTTLTETEQWDHTFGGTFDDLRQRAFSLGDAGYVVVATMTQRLINADGGYALPDAGGSWVTTSARTGPSIAGQAGGNGNDANTEWNCAGFDNLPQNPPLGPALPHHPQMVVPVSDSPVTCPANQAAYYALHLDDALEELYTCLAGPPSSNDEFNFVLWAKLLVAEATLVSTNTHLYFFCNDACSGTLAATQSYGAWSQGGVFPGQNVAMNFRSLTTNPISITLNDNQVEEAMTHEFVHFAGVDHDPWPEGAPPGHDLVYGCGRYCNACQSHITFGGSSSPQSFHDDCARCADDDHRYLCGVTAEAAVLASCGNHDQGCSPACDLCGQVYYSDCDAEVDGYINAQESKGGGQFCCEDTSCGNTAIPPCDAVGYVGAYDGCTKVPFGICSSLH